MRSCPSLQSPQFGDASNNCDGTSVNRLEKDAIKTWLGYFSADGLDPAIHHFLREMDARVTSAFTRVFDALSPRMT